MILGGRETRQGLRSGPMRLAAASSSACSRCRGLAHGQPSSGTSWADLPPLLRPDTSSRVRRSPAAKSRPAPGRTAARPRN